MSDGGFTIAPNIWDKIQKANTKPEFFKALFIEVGTNFVLDFQDVLTDSTFNKVTEDTTFEVNGVPIPLNKDDEWYIHTSDAIAYSVNRSVFVLLKPQFWNSSLILPIFLDESLGVDDEESNITFSLATRSPNAYGITFQRAASLGLLGPTAEEIKRNELPFANGELLLGGTAFFSNMIAKFVHGYSTARDIDERGLYKPSLLTFFSVIDNVEAIHELFNRTFPKLRGWYTQNQIVRQCKIEINSDLPPGDFFPLPEMHPTQKLTKSQFSNNDKYMPLTKWDYALGRYVLDLNDTHTGVPLFHYCLYYIGEPPEFKEFIGVADQEEIRVARQIAIMLNEDQEEMDLSAYKAGSLIPTTSCPVKYLAVCNAHNRLVMNARDIPNIRELNRTLRARLVPRRNVTTNYADESLLRGLPESTSTPGNWSSSPSATKGGSLTNYTTLPPPPLQFLQTPTAGASPQTPKASQLATDEGSPNTPESSSSPGAGALLVQPPVVSPLAERAKASSAAISQPQPAPNNQSQLPPRPLSTSGLLTVFKSGIIGQNYTLEGQYKYTTTVTDAKAFQDYGGRYSKTNIEPYEDFNKIVDHFVFVDEDSNLKDDVTNAINENKAIVYTVDQDADSLNKQKNQDKALKVLVQDVNDFNELAIFIRGNPEDQMVLFFNVLKKTDGKVYRLKHTLKDNKFYPVLFGEKLFILTKNKRQVQICNAKDVENPQLISDVEALLLPLPQTSWTSNSNLN